MKENTFIPQKKYIIKKMHSILSKLKKQQWLEDCEFKNQTKEKKNKTKKNTTKTKQKKNQTNQKPQQK